MGDYTNEIRAAKAKAIDVFFDRLSLHGRVTQAAREAGLEREVMYKKRSQDAAFAERWATAMETYADTIEAEVYRRAVEGTDKGVWHQGTMVGTEKQYSDALLAALIKAKRAREFGDKSKLEMSGPDGGPLQVETRPLDLARKVGFILAKGMAAKEQAVPDADAGMDLA